MNALKKRETIIERYPNGSWVKHEYDENGNLIRLEKSDGYIEEHIIEYENTAPKRRNGAKSIIKP